jgi:DNA-binding MarR family transcriptional regulator
MERVEDCISFLLGKAAREISRRAREKLRPWGVTPSQYAVLKVLWEQNGQSGAAIGDRLVIDSATMTGVIDRLEAAGLLKRRYGSEDRRVRLLFLTARGKSLQVPLDALMDDLNLEVEAEMKSQAAGFWRTLRRLGKTRE